MNEEMRVEAMELCVTACEKHANSNEVCITQSITNKHYIHNKSRQFNCNSGMHFAINSSE